MVLMGVVFVVTPHTVIVGALFAGIWAPVVVAPALSVSGLVPVAGAVSSAVWAIMAMVMVVLVVLWIITYGVVYRQEK